MKDKIFNVSFARTVNEKASKSGVGFIFNGKKNEDVVNELISNFNKSIEARKEANKKYGCKIYDIYGFRITNSITNEVVFEKYEIL